MRFNGAPWRLSYRSGTGQHEVASLRRGGRDLSDRDVAAGGVRNRADDEADALDGGGGLVDGVADNVRHPDVSPDNYAEPAAADIPAINADVDSALQAAHLDKLKAQRLDAVERAVQGSLV